ncbi:uncharacterized protein LOC105703589 [Orussus abietinus]|uniref:uncharacterized protein LOC105703589 n=1 Tax=Orussus abietinus TaxID=222816 RepID=UPI000C715AC4|nr:uncharacterized protein LOC105703589 [Orussus abietinus]
MVTKNQHTLGLLSWTVLVFTLGGPVVLCEEFRDLWDGSCRAADPRNLSVSCHGVRIVKRVVQQLLDKSARSPVLEITDGVSLVDGLQDGEARKARFLKGFGTVGPFLEFLEGRELRIKLPSLVPDNLENAIRDSLPSIAQGRGSGGGGGFGGGKKGDGGMMILALMMGKMMAAMGFGALGLLAMKALMVSALALMLSLIVAVKKLASGHSDGGGHHVVYAQETGHHHRRKRALDDDLLDLPYRGHINLFRDSYLAKA